MQGQTKHIAKKSFGQNFLTNKDICKKIVDLIENFEEKNILEIGPGKGALTDFISKKNFKTFTVIEKDRDLIPNLQQKYTNIDVINKDALQVKIQDILLSKGFKNEKISIIGNLPYNVGTVLILNWLEECEFIDEIVVMLQKEVAERFTAKEKTKDYGIPSILAQKYFDIKIKINVSPNNFSPKPKVDSAVLIFKRKKDVKFTLDEFCLIKKFISIAFQNRRKKIKFSILKLLKANNSQAIQDLNIEFQSTLEKRIEELSVEEIFQFANKINFFIRNNIFF